MIQYCRSSFRVPVSAHSCSNCILCSSLRPSPVYILLHALEWLKSIRVQLMIRVATLMVLHWLRVALSSLFLHSINPICHNSYSTYSIISLAVDGGKKIRSISNGSLSGFPQFHGGPRKTLIYPRFVYPLTHISQLWLRLLHLLLLLVLPLLLSIHHAVPSKWSRQQQVCQVCNGKPAGSHD